MKGIANSSSFQSSMQSDQEPWSISPTLTLTELPSGFSQLPASESLGLSANLPIASTTPLLSYGSTGILGTAHVASVHDDHVPLSSSRQGAPLERPESIEMSFTVSGP